MNQTNFHNNSSYNTPPSANLPAVLVKIKETYRSWTTLHRNFPKVERFGIGKKIENTFLDVLELTFSSIYLSPEQKIIVLGKTITKLDNLKFFLQLAWEHDLMVTEKYADLSKCLGEIGKMLYGWRKGLQQKLPLK